MKDYRIATSESSESLMTFSDKDTKTYLAFSEHEKSFVEISCFSSDEINEYFDRSKILQNFSHPSLSKTIDVYIEEGNVYCVSEFIDGEEIRSYSKRVHSVPVDYITDWILQFLEGLRALESRGLTASLSYSRIYSDRNGETEVLIPECAIQSGNKYANLGDEISEIIKLLANHQDPGEPIVCPREIEVLSGRIKGLEKIDDLIKEIQKLENFNKAKFYDFLYPRPFLSREMFQRYRSDHFLPDSFVAIQKGFPYSIYESLFEDQKTHEAYRVIAVPPERIVPFNCLGLHEDAKKPHCIEIKGLDKHDDFCVITERYLSGFSIEEFIERSGNRSLDEIIYIIERVHEVLDDVQSIGCSLKELFEFNVIVEFEKLGGYGINSLLSVVPVNKWPTFEVKLRMHLTIPTMTRRGGSAQRDNSDELIANIREGKSVSAKQIFTWYLHLQRASLKYAASSFLDDLRNLIDPSTTKFDSSRVKIDQNAVLDESADTSSDSGDESLLEISPIAMAMGYGQDSENNEEEDSNPIAQQINKADDMEEILDLSLLDDHESSLDEFSEPARGKSIIFAIIFMLLAIGMALFLAHLSGRAFWLQP